MEMSGLYTLAAKFKVRALDMRFLKTPGNSAPGIVAGKKGAVKVHRPKINLVFACLLLLVAALTAIPAFAAPRAEALSHTRPVPERTVASGPGDPAEMEAFLDDFFETKMAELHIPGAAIVVVQDGKVFLAKGYGYADLARQTPVDPTRITFRAGSISKLFTWTAVMQAAERGLLDLDADVNRYLTDFQVPDTYPQPVTLAHLLTHTAGFEDRWIGIQTRDPDELEPLGRALADAMPRRVEAPGIVHSYSNYGTNLAGHLVEQVSGLSFDQFVEENILHPLGMDGTTFRQPLPEPLATNLATGYSYVDDELEAAPLIYAKMAPASAVTLTPIDMATFMIAHLHEGAYGDVRILEPATAQEMHRQQFTHHPDMPGMAYGFKERFINGLRVIGHGGDIHTFAGQMILIPEEDLGFFLVYNRFDDAFREQLVSAFFDHYYPVQGEGPVPQAVEMSSESLERFAGSYRWVKYPRSTLGKLIALVPGPYPIIVEANQDTSLSLSFFGADAAWRYVPVGQNVFKQVEGGPQLLGGLQIDPGDTLAFRENQAGEVTYGMVSLQNTAFEKLAWYESAEAQMGTMGSILLLFVSAVVLWPLGALIRRLRKRDRESNPARRRALWVGWMVSGMNLVFLLVLLMSFGEELVFGVPLSIRIILVIPIVTSMLSVVFLALAVIAWMRGYWSLVGRLYYSLIALASVLFVLFAGYWNMLGWRF
jgi:CubicO group peptidase (beta-lactamase class C family)